MEEEKKKKSTYSEAQKRAIKKYMDNNREKINAQRREYYKTKKDNDPNYVKYKRDKAKEFYNKKKLVNVIKETVEDIKDDIKEEIKETIEDIKEDIKDNVKDGVNEFLNIITENLKDMNIKK